MQGWFNTCKSINGIQHINTLRDRNYMIISLAAGKVFDKIQFLFIIKALENIRIQGIYLNIRKAIYSKPTANKMLKKIKSVSIKIRNKTIMSTHSTPSQYIM